MMLSPLSLAGKVFHLHGYQVVKVRVLPPCFTLLSIPEPRLISDKRIALPPLRTARDGFRSSRSSLLQLNQIPASMDVLVTC
ncbi:MAG: hypothetical protein WA949_19445, partial [Phormidesmis sp.]